MTLLKTSILLVVSLLYSFSIRACICNCSLPNVEDNARIVDEVFIGTLHEMYQHEMDNGNLYRALVFKISKKWKGDSHQRVTVYFDPTLCGNYPYQLNRSYLIYAAYDQDSSSLFQQCYLKTIYPCWRNAEVLANGNMKGSYDDRPELDQLYPETVAIFPNELRLGIYLFSGLLVTGGLIRLKKYSALKKESSNN